MKPSIIIFIRVFILVFVLGFANCNKQKTISVTPLTYEVSEMAGVFEISIKSNTSWTVGTNDDWCSVDIVSGKNDGIVKVSYQSNNEPNKRTSTIYIEGKNADQQEITITQDNKCYLTKQIANNDTTVYEYDYNNLLIKKTKTTPLYAAYYIYTYEYNSDNNVSGTSIDATSNGGFYPPLIADLVTYDYNLSGQFIKETSFLDADTTLWTDFFYNESGLIERYEYFGLFINEKNNKRLYRDKWLMIYSYDANENIINSIQYKIIDGAEVKYKEISYLYGDMKNPFLNMSIPKTGKLIGVNNVTSIIETIYENEVPSTHTTTYEYEFNENGYPTKRTDGDGYSVIYEYK